MAVSLAWSGLRARRAHRLWAVAARLVEPPVGQVVGVLAVEDPAGGGLDGGQGAGQADRAGAPGGGFDVVQPVEVVGLPGAVQRLSGGGAPGRGLEPTRTAGYAELRLAVDVEPASEPAKNMATDL